MRWIDTVLRDLWYGARMFLRQPGSTVLAVTALSLGIGANAVVYSLLHAVLLRPLPFPQPERLVAILDNFRGDGVRNVPPTVPELLDVRGASQHLEGISFFDMRDVQINGGTEPARASAARVEAAFLSTLGVQPALGRLFTQDDQSPGRDRVVVLTHSFWRRNFAANPDVINQDIVVNGVTNTVIGVLPPRGSFDYLSSDPIELYVPFPTNDSTYTSRTGEFANVRRVTAIARLKGDATLEQADAEVATISQRLRADHPHLYRRGSDGQDLGFHMTVRPLREVVTFGGRPLVLMLFGAVVLVLLIACVNTVQFLLARAVERQQEVRIRIALGAGVGRLLRQFLTEASLLASIGAGVGVLQAIWLMALLRALVSSRSPLLADLTVDTTVIAYALGMAVVVTIVCGLFPAMHVARRSSAVGWARTSGAARSGTRHALIALEVAISIVLLVSAGLLVGGIRQLQSAPRGYSAEDVTVMRMRVAGRVGSGTGATYQRYLSGISAVDGVESVAVASAPLHGFPGVEFAIAGRPDDAATLASQRASWRIVSPEYFRVLRIPIVAGRSFTDDDAAGRPHVAIINEQMARRFWPGQNPIGAPLRSGTGPRTSVATIVGIAGDVRPLLQREIAPQIYVSYLQQSEPNITLLVRSTPNSNVPVEAIKQAVWSVVPEQPVFGIRPLADAVEQAMAEPRLVAKLLGAFASLALLISTLGVYTLVSYLTARRTREVAVRRAIGADSLDVMRLLVVPTLVWSFAGVTIGAIAAVIASNVLRSVVLGIARFELPTVAAIAAVYLGVVAVAVAVPAARALRIEPARILRAE